MPFSVELKIKSDKAKTTMQLFEKSIRPFQIKTLSIESKDAELTLSIDGVTYFQPEKNLDLKMETLRK